MIPIASNQNPQPANRLREWARTGGRTFSRALGSFPSYNRRMMRNIHTRWRNFRETHRAATKYAK